MSYESSKAWVDGFFDGYNGVLHQAGKGEDYDNGYSRGYETAQIHDANTLWMEQRGYNKGVRA